MATGLLPSFGGFSMEGIVNYIIWGSVIIGALILISVFVIMIIMSKKSFKVAELNLETKKVQLLNGRFKKKKSGIKALWLNRLKKYLPTIQQADILTNKGRDFLLLFKDNNGLHHAARLPTHEELKKWYSVVHKVDIEEKDEAGIFKYESIRTKFETMFLIPNPSEDLDWLGTQCTEAEHEFTDVWWRHPNVMIIGVAAISAVTFIITLIVSAKMT